MQSINEVIQEIEPGPTWREMPASEPRQPQRVTLDTLDTSHATVAAAVKAARNWAQRKRDGHADASQHDSDMAVPAGRFFMANDLLMSLAPTDGEFGMSHVPRIAGLIGYPPLVVLDDVGGQQMLQYIKQSNGGQEQELAARYFRFIDHCYTFNVSVIITTNLSIAGGHDCKLAHHIGGRAWDRLCQMAPRGFMVGLNGVPSWRVASGGRG
jgi:hypothetical protein